MKLQSKFALYNALSKLIIILVFAIVMPFLIRYIAIINTDRQLQEKKEEVIRMIESVGISSFIEEGSEDGYGSYNLLKEEFISLEQTDSAFANVIENSPRLVEDEIVNYRVLSYTFYAEGKQYLLEVARSLSTIQEIESTLRRFAFVTLLIISLITIVMDVAFTKFLLRPLNLIIKKLHAVKDPSSFRFKKVPTTTTDFRYLDTSIHEMMTRVEDAFLKERQFISNVSHELLTPVSILQGKLENMLGSETLSETAAWRLVESQKTLVRLKNIVRALLLISKIENDQFLRTEVVSINRLVDDVLTEIEDRLAAKEIEVDTESLEDYEADKCNSSLLHTMLFNLVNNAIKYNRVGGKIIICGAAAPSGYMLEIRDTGVGIPPELIPSVFNRFKRLHKADGESFGLGLPIVKTIAAFHDIELDVTSVPGDGSTFRLFFKRTSGFVPATQAIVPKAEPEVSTVSS
jgi:signal transduction histidine kinase